MKKLFLLLIINVLFNSCLDQKTRKIDIIVYEHSFIPNYNYEKLINNFLKSNLIDSLKVIGRPLHMTSANIEIDTLMVHQLNISLTKLKNKVETINYEKLEFEYIENNSGQKVPLSSLISISLFSDYDKPEIYIPEPIYFSYKGEQVTKIEIYHKKNIKTKLEGFIKKQISEEGLEFEFIN